MTPYSEGHSLTTESEKKKKRSVFVRGRGGKNERVHGVEEAEEEEEAEIVVFQPAGNGVLKRRISLH